MRRLIVLSLGFILGVSCALSGCGYFNRPARLDAPGIAPSDPAGLDATPADQPQVAGESALLGACLPSPLQALAKLRAARQASWSPGDYLCYGQGYQDALAHPGVSILGSSAQFTSTWESAAAPSFADLAYAFYAPYIPDTTGVASLATDWTTAPTAGTGCFIGLGDFTRDTWAWFALPASGEIPLAALADYLDQSLMLVAVCVLEEGPCRLNWVRAGPNLAPSAEINADTIWGQAPLTVEFDLSGSYDPEQKPLLYEWDWDSDGVYDESGLQSSSQHEFTAYGKHTVTGRATDPGGASGTAAIDVWPTRFKVGVVARPAYSPALVLDGAGNPVVSYSGGEGHDELKLAKLRAGAWESTALETVSGELDVETAIDIAGRGDLALAYGGGKLHYGVYDGAAFTSEVVADKKGRGQPALALDNDDSPNILYAGIYGSFPLTYENLTHAYQDGGWQFIRISNTGVDGPWVDAEYRGNLVAAYLHRETSGAVGELRYGDYSTVPGWSWKTLTDQVARGNDVVHLAVASDNMPHLAYATEPVNPAPSELKYTHLVETTWVTESVVDWPDEFALALDQADLPHLVFTQDRELPDETNVYYAVSDGAAWQIELAWVQSPAGLADLDLAIGADGTPHLVFADMPDDAANTKVYYATFME